MIELRTSKQRFCGDTGIFYEGLAVSENRDCHVLENGEPAYQERYDLVEYFQNGLAWAKKDNKWIRIDKSGKKVKTRNTSSVG